MQDNDQDYTCYTSNVTSMAKYREWGSTVDVLMLFTGIYLFKSVDVKKKKNIYHHAISFERDNDIRQRMIGLVIYYYLDQKVCLFWFYVHLLVDLYKE